MTKSKLLLSAVLSMVITGASFFSAAEIVQAADDTQMQPAGEKGTMGSETGTPAVADPLDTGTTTQIDASTTTKKGTKRRSKRGTSTGTGSTTDTIPEPRGTIPDTGTGGTPSGPMEGGSESTNQ